MTINRQNFPAAAGKRGAFIFLRFSDSENSGGRLLISENLPKSAGGRLLRAAVIYICSVRVPNFTILVTGDTPDQAYHPSLT